MNKKLEALIKKMNVIGLKVKLTGIKPIHTDYYDHYGFESKKEFIEFKKREGKSAWIIDVMVLSDEKDFNSNDYLVEFSDGYQYETSGWHLKVLDKKSKWYEM